MIKEGVERAGKGMKDEIDAIPQSTSGFEAGPLTASPEINKTLGNKEHLILGLYLPSTMCLPTFCNGSTASSIPLVTASGGPLSVESAVKVMD